MAHLRKLPSCSKCNKRATVELYNRRNESYGRFCSQHGVGELNNLEKIEEENDEFVKAHPNVSRRSLA